MLLCFLYNHPLFISTIFIFILFAAFYNLGACFTISKLKGGFLFCFVMSFFNPLINHRGAHILFYLFGKSITLEAVAYSGYLFLLLASMLAVFVIINNIIGPNKVLYLFSKALPQTGFMLSMTLRFSGLFKKQATDYTAVQTSRKLSDNRFSSRLHEGTSVLLGFTTYVLENGLKTSEHLRANEYGTVKRSLYLQYPVTLADTIFIFLTANIVIYSIPFSFSQIGHLDYYKNLASFQLGRNDIFAYIMIVVYLMLPFLMDITHYLQEKIICR